MNEEGSLQIDATGNLFCWGNSNEVKKIQFKMIVSLGYLSGSPCIKIIGMCEE